ncbi:MAG: hypothetical protein U5L04_08755 [Trueperaceae bacterium]|nr:hypothetical protein [Trueperaceae bacterium]
MNHENTTSLSPVFSDDQTNDDVVSTTDQPHYVAPTLTIFPDYVDSTLGGSLPGF